MNLFYGDSITAGKPGVSYLNYLSDIGKNINLGLGGDTVLGLLSRIDKFLRPNIPKHVFIEIGANDVLLPFLDDYSPSWHKMVAYLEKRGSKPVSGLNEFSDKYKLILNKLTAYNTTCISIPCIGENISSILNIKVYAYNEVIANLCHEHGLLYIDFNNWQKEQVAKNKIKDMYFISKKYSDVLFDTLVTTYLSLSNIISRKRGLVTTVDGVHLNSRSAQKLASMIKDRLLL